LKVDATGFHVVFQILNALSLYVIVLFRERYFHTDCYAQLIFDVQEVERVHALHLTNVCDFLVPALILSDNISSQSF